MGTSLSGSNPIASINRQALVTQATSRQECVNQPGGGQDLNIGMLDAIKNELRAPYRRQAIILTPIYTPV